ncbi:hypothetical protein OQA88_12550 [Cercophora sp. LCS_1]
MSQSQGNEPMYGENDWERAYDQWKELLLGDENFKKAVNEANPGCEFQKAVSVLKNLLEGNEFGFTITLVAEGDRRISNPV